MSKRKDLIVFLRDLADELEAPIKAHSDVESYKKSLLARVDEMITTSTALIDSMKASGFGGGVHRAEGWLQGISAVRRILMGEE